MKLLIDFVLAVVVCGSIGACAVVWACCVVGKKADEAMERWHK